MVEKYKREGIDIVLGSRKCIYTDEKNKKFIKQNKKYIPIIKRKGEYVIINRKGGGLESSKIINDIKNLNEKIESNNAMIADINNKSTKKTSNVDEERIIKITIENTKMLSSVNEKKDEYNIQMSFETYDNIKEKVIEKTRDEEKETSDKKRVIEKEKQDKEAIEQIKLKTDIETQQDKVIEQNKMRLKALIEKEKENIQLLNIKIENIDKNIKLLDSQSYVFYNDSRRAATGVQIKEMKSAQMMIKSVIISSVNRIKDYLQQLSKLETKKKNELEWASTANPEKEQFLKEIVEKVTLSNSLEELYTNYKDKMNREVKYLNSYLKEKNIVPILLFADTPKEKGNYTEFMLEMLLNRINDLQERIKIIEKK